MRTRQTSRIIPIRAGKRYRKKPAVTPRRQAASLLGKAALLGAVIGTASIVATPERIDMIAEKAKPFAVAAGLMRARAPQEGDYWPGCNAARAAGTAPIYIGEPGYREGMDGDGDGVACEPHY